MHKSHQKLQKQIPPTIKKDNINTNSIIKKKIAETKPKRKMQTWVLTAIALFSGIGESAPQGPLKDNIMRACQRQSENQIEEQRNC